MPPPEAPVSNMDRVRGLAQALLRYVAVRGKLFQIEAQEAGGQLATVAIMGVIGLGALGGAWLLLIPAAISYIAGKWHQPWEYVAAGAGAAHLFVAMILLLGLKHRLQRLKLFEESLNQFEKDRTWVAHETQPK